MLLRNLLITMLWLLVASIAVQAKQLALIAHKENTTSNVTAAQLRKILTGHDRNWPDGKAITVVIREPATADMQIVLNKLLDMSKEQVQGLIQSHRDIIVVADSDQDVIRFVIGKRGAIGIVDLYSLTKDVNVIKIDGKLPVEQGYLLRGN